MPTEFPDILRAFSKELLKDKPKDVYSYCKWSLSLLCHRAHTLLSPCIHLYLTLHTHVRSRIYIHAIPKKMLSFLNLRLDAAHEYFMNKIEEKAMADELAAEEAKEKELSSAIDDTANMVPL